MKQFPLEETHRTKMGALVAINGVKSRAGQAGGGSFKEKKL